MPECLPDTEAKVTGIGVHKAGGNASIASLTMNQSQFGFAHLPRLPQDFAKCSVKDDFRG